MAWVVCLCVHWYVRETETVDCWYSVCCAVQHCWWYPWQVCQQSSHKHVLECICWALSDYTQMGDYTFAVLVECH